jgi:hypothetical protein
MTKKADEKPDDLKIFHVGHRRYGLFYAGEYVDTLDFEQAQPLMLLPSARREFLAARGLREQ